MNFGVVGTSFIMDTILYNMHKTGEMNIECIYSNSPSRAKGLMEQYNIPILFDNYSNMCSYNDIDWIYICSPNSLHYSQAKEALLAGKNVLLEKPSTVHVSELKELIDIAKSKHLFLFEAIIPMFHPNLPIIKENISKLGKLKLGIGTFLQYSSRYEALLKGDVPNVFNPKFAGGALMDLNLYNIYFYCSLFGKPDLVTYNPQIYSNGIDTNGIATLTFGDLKCECIAAKDASGDNSAQIIGENGYIKVTPCASNLKKVEIFIKGQEPIVHEACNNPWFYEMSGLIDIVKRNDYNECYKRLETALYVCDVLEKGRLDGGLNF